MSMRSTFFGLEIGRTGLFVSQRQLDVTAHNIANADVPGYTRQRAVTAAIDPYSVLMRFAPADRGVVGAGVQILHVEQIRDKYLDKQIRDKFSLQGEWRARAESYYNIESLFDELRDSSLTSVMGNFFDSLHQLFLNPEKPENRVYVQQNGILLTDVFHDYYDSLVREQTNLNSQFEVVTEKINSIAENIAMYNELIFGFELTGEFANDLRDKRNVLIDELAQLVDITYFETGSSVPGSPGKLVIQIDGVDLVNHKTATKVYAVADKTNPIAGEDDLFQLYWDDGTGNPSTNLVNYKSGKLRGLEDMRDGNTVETMGVPYMVDQLNKLVDTMVTLFNDIHQRGYTYPYTDDAGVFHSSADQTDFFEDTGRTAKTIKLTDAILESAMNFAASSEAIDLTVGNTNSGNQQIALELSKLITQKNTIDSGSFEEFLGSVVVILATRADYVYSQSEAQDYVCLMLDSQRLSISGVSLDEEMTNMIKFQHAYNGAARIITTMDEALDKLINHTGVVGLA